MMGKQESLSQALENLLELKSCMGAALVSRDGLPVRAVGVLDLHRETFSAMSATVLGATEIALGEISGGNVNHLIATTGRLRLVMLGVTDDLLLAVSASAEGDLDELLPSVEETARRLAQIAAGG